MKPEILAAIENNFETDNAEIGRAVTEGYTNGMLDNPDGYRIVWSLTVDKFENK